MLLGAASAVDVKESQPIFSGDPTSIMFGIRLYQAYGEAGLTAENLTTAIRNHFEELKKAGLIENHLR